MEHDLELFSPILEILEIGVCNIIYNPGNIGKHIFSLSPILEIVDRTIQYLLIILKTSLWRWAGPWAASVSKCIAHGQQLATVSLAHRAHLGNIQPGEKILYGSYDPLFPG